MPDTIPTTSISAFMAAADMRPHPYPILMAIMFHTGVRVGELRTLAWCDLMTDTVALTALRITAHNSKTNRARVIPINAPLAQRLHEIWHGWARPKGFGRGQYVAAQTPAGHPVTVRTIERHVAVAGRKAGLPNVTPHVLRHTFATRLLEVSNLELVRKALGHSRVSTTQIYVHTTTEELANAVNKQADVFTQLTGPRPTDPQT